MAPWPTDEERRRKRERERYAEQHPGALDRQVELAETLLPCCGLPKPGPHHEACHLYEAPTEPEVHPDQEALI
jgi:hypothetical protein